MKNSLFILIFSLLINFSLFSKSNDSRNHKIAYLGIYATKVNPSLSHQLNLTENLYLSVERVAKNSPAERGGIQKFDLLIQLNEQILVNQDQLKHLVRSKLPQDEVTLTILRHGKKRKVVLNLGEINLQEDNRYPTSIFDHPFSNHDRILEDSENIRDLMYRWNPSFNQGRNFGRYRKILPPSQSNDDPLHPKTNIESFSNQSSQSQVMITDEQGSLEWTEINGKKSLRATDPDGKVLFHGPIDTLEERESLTENLKTRLHKLETDLQKN